VRRRSCATATATVAAALIGSALVACGTPSHDLFVVTRSGDLPGARLELLVSDGGTATCNGERHDLTSEQLIEAREIERDLEEPGSRGLALPPRAGSQLTYSVRLETGTVRFSDNSQGQPAAFFRLAAFVRATAKGVCGLRR
jgi:hypothetical protein